MRYALIVALMLCVGFSSGCDSSPAPGDSAIYEVEVAGSSSFRMKLTDEAAIQRAERLLESGDEHAINGELARSDGGFNSGYSWHMVPGTITFPDLTTEVCQGQPTTVEKDVAYWVGTVGRYCPISAVIVERVA